MTRRPLEALDPDSAKGREVAARLTEVFVDVRAEIEAAEAQQRLTATRTPSP